MFPIVPVRARSGEARARLGGARIVVAIPMGGFALALFDRGRHSNVVQAIQTLTGTYFGLTPGTPSPPAVRRKAVTEFSKWIREHPGDAMSPEPR